MQVYKAFFKVIRQHKLSLVIYVGVTLFMLIVLVQSTGNDTKKVTQDKYSLYVVDNDHSEISEALYQYLDSVHTLKKDSLTENQINDLMYYQHIAEYIEIPEGFGDSFMELVNESRETGYAGNDEAEDSAAADITKLLKVVYDEALPRGIFVNMQMNEYLNGILSYMRMGDSIDEASEKTAKALDSSAFVTIQKKDVQPAVRTYTAFLFLPFGILSIIFSQILPVIVSFNEKEKKNRTAVSSTSLSSRNISLVAGTVTVALVVIVVLIAGATMAEGKKYLFSEMWWLTVLNVVVYAVSITMLLSMISSLPISIEKKSSVNTSAYITNIIGLSFSFLGGTFVDLEILGDKVGRIGRFLPNYWYSVATRRIWYEGAGFSQVIECYGLQLIFGITCLAIGLAFTRYFGNKAE